MVDCLLRLTVELVSDPLLPGSGSSRNRLVVGLVVGPHLDLFGLDGIVSVVELVIGHEEIAKEREGGRGDRGDEKWSDGRIVAWPWVSRRAVYGKQGGIEED